MNFFARVDELLEGLTGEEMEDEREIIAGVCQGCQEVKSCCDCPSEDSRRYFNQAIAQLNTKIAKLRKELNEIY